MALSPRMEQPFSRRRVLGGAAILCVYGLSGCTDDCADRLNVEAFIVSDAPNQTEIQPYEDQPELVQRYVRKAVEQNATRENEVDEQLTLEQTKRIEEADIVQVYVAYQGETVLVRFGRGC